MHVFNWEHGISNAQGCAWHKCWIYREVKLNCNPTIIYIKKRIAQLNINTVGSQSSSSAPMAPPYQMQAQQSELDDVMKDIPERENLATLRDFNGRVARGLCPLDSP